MATIPKVFVEYQDIPSAATLVYTGSTSARGFYIDTVTSTNYSGATVSVSLWLVPPGGSTANSNKVFISKGIAPNDIYTFPAIVGKFQTAGTQIYIQASSASSANINITGREVT